MKTHGQAVENRVSRRVLPYHVTWRGKERRKIFRVDRDRESFLERLALSLEICRGSLLCCLLMDNHFHLLLMTPKGNLWEFMRRYTISYTSAFNCRHGRVAHLCQWAELGTSLTKYYTKGRVS
jgi:putative transposase